MGLIRVITNYKDPVNFLFQQMANFGLYQWIKLMHLIGKDHWNIRFEVLVVVSVVFW